MKRDAVVEQELPPVQLVRSHRQEGAATSPGLVDRATSCSWNALHPPPPAWGTHLLAVQDVFAWFSLAKSTSARSSDSG